MSIWDSLCHMLRARQVSVEDVSNKVQPAAAALLHASNVQQEHVWLCGMDECSRLHFNAQGGMELRVLHVAAWRTTWYGRWNYEFGRGGFGIPKAAWRRAAEAVCRAPLAAVLDDFRGSDLGIEAIAQRYQV
jgi:hypothetical protein